MKPEELKNLIQQRKQKRKSDLELLKITVLVYRKMIRKHDAEMNYYSEHNERKAFQEVWERYVAAAIAEAEARRKLYNLAISPLFTQEEQENIIQDRRTGIVRSDACGMRKIRIRRH